MRLLASGQHDAMLVSKLAGMQTIRNHGIAGVMALDARVGFSQRFAFAVRKGDTELLTRINEGLALAKAEGVYDRLYEKWFGPYRSAGTWLARIPRRLAAAALIALVVWLVALRNRVRRDRRNAAILARQRRALEVRARRRGRWRVGRQPRDRHVAVLEALEGNARLCVTTRSVTPRTNGPSGSIRTIGRAYCDAESVMPRRER